MTIGLSVTLQVLVALAICWVGSWLYGYLHAGKKLDQELTFKDNTAMAVPYGGYLLGILLILSGPQAVSARTFELSRLGDFVMSGILGIGLVSIAFWVEQRFLFPEYGLWKKVTREKSISAGIVLAGIHIANALIARGALSEEGGLQAAFVFWGYAQLLWMIALHTFLKFSRYHLKHELRRDNCAVSLAFSGGAIAMGNLMGCSIAGAFVSWTESFVAATEFAFASLAFLYLIHRVTDWAFFPRVTIHDEILRQSIPNIGVGFLVMIFYIGLSFLIGASLS